MAHELEIINNEASMFYTGATPWHRLGQRFLQPPTTEEALEAAKLNWDVGLRPLFNEYGSRSTHQETFRVDTGDVLGVVGPNYHPLQNTQAFNFFNPLVEDGTLSYETAGVMAGGKRVWILAKAKGDPMEIARNDIVERYVLLSNSHDGTMAIRVGYTPIRVVCANTLAMAIGATDSKLLKVRHTSNAQLALEEIRNAMVVAENAFKVTAEQYKLLTKYQVNEGDIKKYVEVVFGLKPEEERKREAKSLTRVLDLFTDGRGQDNPAVRGTVWALYNGVTEYLQHEAGRSDEGRLNSLWFGPNASRNKKALEAALLIAQAKAA